MSPSISPTGYFGNSRHEMLPYLPAQAGRLLDIGCGEGVFASICKERLQCEVWGLEYNEQIAAQAKTRLDRVIVGDAIQNARELPDACFDVITCNDVLEHLTEPEQLLLELRRTLTPGGIVVSSIPNIRYYYALRKIIVERDFPREDEGIFDRTHLRFFTQKTIHRMFADCGYRIVRIEGINPTKRRGFRMLNGFLFGALDDCRYLQFACVARPI